MIKRLKPIKDFSQVTGECEIVNDHFPITCDSSQTVLVEDKNSKYKFIMKAKIFPKYEKFDKNDTLFGILEIINKINNKKLMKYYGNVMCYTNNFDDEDYKLGLYKILQDPDTYLCASSKCDKTPNCALQLIFYEYIENTRTLRDLIDRYILDPLGVEQLEFKIEYILSPIVDLVMLLRKHNIKHGDLNARNILIDMESYDNYLELNNKIEAYLIDFDDAKIDETTNYKDGVKDDLEGINMAILGKIKYYNTNPFNIVYDHYNSLEYKLDEYLKEVIREIE
jgi:tRNA A-37 threonylcarbamoyl transferase component Bud32